MTTSYGPDPRNVIKSYAVSSIPENKVLIFIHGGAWRDPLNTCNDTDDMARHLCELGPKQSCGKNFFSIDYKLSPENKHPSFVNDVTSAIKKIYEIVQYRSENSAKQFYLSGHSVGATLVLQYLSQKDITVIPEKCFLLDGIYNLEELVCEYKDYESFVLDAHHDKAQYTLATTFQIRPISKYVLVQSTKDELLSMQQTTSFEAKLLAKNLCVEKFVNDYGSHNNVYISEKVAQIIYNELK